MKSKKYIFILVINSMLSLVFGLFIYLFMKQNTFVSKLILENFKFPSYMAKTVIGVGFYNWGCDFLWSYSLNFALNVALNSFEKSMCICSFIVIVLGIILEFLQMFNITSGTFDITDIISEIIAVLVSGLIIYKLKRMMKK